MSIVPLTLKDKIVLMCDVITTQLNSHDKRIRNIDLHSNEKEQFSVTVFFLLQKLSRAFQYC